MPTLLLPAYSDDGPDAALAELDATAARRVMDWIAKAEALAPSGVRGLLCELPCPIRYVHTSAGELGDHVEGPFAGGEPVLLPDVVCELSGISELEGERTEWDLMRIDRGAACFETQVKHGSLASTADIPAALLRQLAGAFTLASEAAL
jgi:hypothetical protein